MSSVKGVNKTLVDAGGVAKIAQGNTDARLKVMTDYYEASGLATSSNIKLGSLLPAGARIVDVKLTYDALSTVTLSVGDADSNARYISALATANAAGTKACDLADGVDYVIGTASTDNQIIIYTTGVSAATGTIKLSVIYAVD
jgi:hypothetical protein